MSSHNCILINTCMSLYEPILLYSELYTIVHYYFMLINLYLILNRGTKVFYHPSTFSKCKVKNNKTETLFSQRETHLLCK